MPVTKTGTLKGPVGPVGDPGNTGAQGAQGAPGAQGPPGAQGAVGPVAASADASNVIGLGSDSGLVARVASVPVADPTKNGLVAKLSGLSTDYLNGNNACLDLATAVKPQIYVMGRSGVSNAIANPNFEVDQRTVGSGLTLFGGAASSGFPIDGWILWKGGTGALSAQGIQQGYTNQDPRTGYLISSAIFMVSSQAQQATLGANDGLALIQNIEVPRLRALYQSHSLSLLVRCSAPFKFGIALRDNASTVSLVNLGTIASSYTWTLIPLPNLPAWPNVIRALRFGPGTIGYQLLITLAMGSSSITPANGTWQTGNFIGAIGQDNFGALPLNSTFQIGFIQHEPGPYCSNFLECAFQKNLLTCQRYFAKSQGYAIAVPTASQYRGLGSFLTGSTACRLNIVFPVEMAKAPTMTFWNHVPTINTLYVSWVNASAPIASYAYVSTRGVGQANMSASGGAAQYGPVMGQWKADTGW
jgi:hypothetical protein